MKIFRVLKKNDGAAAVEFAIIAPLFFVLLFGIIEFSALLYNQAVITNASREAARYSATFYTNPAGTATRPTCGEVKSYVEQYVNAKMLSFTDSTPFSIDNVSCPDGTPYSIDTASSEGRYAGYVSTIRIDYTYGFLVFGNLITLLGGDKWASIDLSAETAMRDENQS
jgi:Flp pilus assembly protein TadG